LPGLFDRVRRDANEFTRTDDGAGVLDREVVLTEVDAVGVDGGGDGRAVVDDGQRRALILFPIPSP
jgi:hypothetical protein